MLHRHAHHLGDLVRPLGLFLAEEGQAKAVVLQHLLQCLGPWWCLAQKIDQLQRNLLRALVFWAQSPHRVFNQAGQLLGQAGGQHLDRGAGAGQHRSLGAAGQLQLGVLDHGRLQLEPVFGFHGL